MVGTVFTRHLGLWFLLVLFAWLYASTLYPGIGGRINYGDSVKWQLLWLVDGIPHAPGYPLFLALTHFAGNAFSFLPEPQRISSLSMIFALLLRCRSCTC